MGLKYHLITFGCQMNKSDSERLAALLDSLGLVETADETAADLILLNTCSVRQAAEDRIFGKLKEFGRLRESKPDLIVGVTGCLPGRDKDGKIRAKMPGADLYFPIHDMTQLPRWLAELRPDFATCGEMTDDYLKIRPRHTSAFQAFVPIQTGCNKFCTYCVVPHARGLEKNRPAADILSEAAELVGRGVVEITLLGQAVNAYCAPDPSSFSAANPYKDHFAALLWEIDRLSGLRRIHYTASYPTHMTEEVIDALALPHQVNYLHLPVQGGNDEVLKRMNRRYTSAQYLDIIRRVNERRPGIALGTDIIVGFCGETAEQFEDTLRLYRAADFDISYNAMYSVRSGTQAAQFYKDDVPREEKKRRWNALQDLMEETVFRKNQTYFGRVVEVLVERRDRAVPAGRQGFWVGNTREMKLARFRSDADLTGQIVLMKVTKSMTWMLEGEKV
ncbi:MAG: tRNA (N6-isopentenyl adenosine(37)-C2)-methylthiotransferase MiaB [Patescibacteria group bacterium]|nr:tRNA (N6-isopentenyl adenosine(37)-C2)-methylthiotransferase MiaB [Patescibacteria group bacterium]